MQSDSLMYNILRRGARKNRIDAFVLSRLRPRQQYPLSAVSNMLRDYDVRAPTTRKRRYSEAKARCGELGRIQLRHWHGTPIRPASLRKTCPASHEGASFLAIPAGSDSTFNRHRPVVVRGRRRKTCRCPVITTSDDRCAREFSLRDRGLAERRLIPDKICYQE
jgi:hypothetical protein